MRSYNIRHLPVVDGEGKLVGIVSIRDIARALDDLFEGDME
jgi:CBS domain pair.